MTTRVQKAVIETINPSKVGVQSELFACLSLHHLSPGIHIALAASQWEGYLANMGYLGGTKLLVFERDSQIAQAIADKVIERRLSARVSIQPTDIFSLRHWPKLKGPVSFLDLDLFNAPADALVNQVLSLVGWIRWAPVSAIRVTLCLRGAKLGVESEQVFLTHLLSALGNNGKAVVHHRLTRYKGLGTPMVMMQVIFKTKDVERVATSEPLPSLPSATSGLISVAELQRRYKDLVGYQTLMSWVRKGRVPSTPALTMRGSTVLKVDPSLDWVEILQKARSRTRKLKLAGE
jgi:hypothetical protein